MKRIKRIAPFAAAIVLLVVAGCRRNGPDILIENGTGGPRETVPRSGETGTLLPEGTDFTVLRTARAYECGDSLSRAEYLRDLEMRESLSVAAETETASDDGETLDRFLVSSAAGEDRYAIVVGSVSKAGYPILCSGYAASPERCPALDFSRFPASLSAAGPGLAVGAVAPGSYGDPSCVLMNLDAARTFNVTLPSAWEGWTFDDMVAAAAAIPTGTGFYRYGAADPGIGPAWVRAAGDRLTESACGNLLVSPEPSGKAGEIIRLAAGVLGDEKQTSFDESAKRTFEEGRVLFLFCKTSDAMELRSAETDFLILPYPSGRTGAAGYADSVSGEAAAIPSSGLDGARKQMIREYDRLSGKYVDAERRDALLSGPSAYDEASRSSVDALLRDAEYELCEACGTGGLSDALSRAITDLSGAIPSDYPARAAAVSAELKDAF